MQYSTLYIILDQQKHRRTINADRVPATIASVLSPPEPIAQVGVAKDGLNASLAQQFRST